MRTAVNSVVLLFLVFSPIPTDSRKSSEEKGAYLTGIYHNLFTEVLGKSQHEVDTRIHAAFEKLFYGDGRSERVYYPAGTDMAYVEDVLHEDVRSEGMSYGMMIAVQLDRKQEFDRLWKWAKTYMQHNSGIHKNYFAWHCSPSGSKIDQNAASDGEEWFVMSLFLASARWGDGDGIFNYRREAQTILGTMLHKEEEAGNDGSVTNMFSENERQVVFVPSEGACDITDPSYHLPHFYELWGRWADRDREFWCSAATTSRKFLRKTVDPATGLAPDYALFDGTPTDLWNGGHADFRFDAWRVAMNVAIDYSWFAKDPWAIEQSNRLLSFFTSRGVRTYGNQYTLQGKQLTDDHSAGLVAMNAVACLASTHEKRKEFLEDFWNTPVPRGTYRYYDGLLYMLAMLQVSGNFRVYHPNGEPVPECGIQ